MPETGARLRFAENTPPTVLDTSNPAGAPTVRFAVRFEPLTVKDCAAEALPKEAVKPVNATGVTEIDGVAAEPTMPESVTDLGSAPGLASVMLPLTGPTDAEEAMRA